MRELTIEEIKNTELGSLKQLHDFCVKNNLKYWLAYGTLLGAVRHKGFIPWDDDIDVIMPRSDFNYLINNFNRQFQNHKKIVTIYNNANYYLNAAKIIDERTGLIERVYKSCEIGCYIDVFPLDYVPDDEQKALSFLKKIQRKFDLFRIINIGYNREWNFFKKVLWCSLFPIRVVYPRRKILMSINNFSQYYNETYKKNWALASYDSFGSIRYYDSSLWNETICLEFEGYEFFAPKQYDKILTISYGDYMTPPPIEKQVTHHGFKCWWKE